MSLTWHILPNIVNLRRILPEDAVEEFRLMYLIFRAGWSRLTHEALDSQQCRWPQRPKGHYLEHMTYDTLPWNPRYSHNFVSEDMVRRIKQLAIKSHPAFLSRHVAFKYTLQCCLKWRNMLQLCSCRCKLARVCVCVYKPV